MADQGSDPDSVRPDPIRTRRLTLTPMSAELVRAVVGGDWDGAELLLGTPFPLEWRDDGWQWLVSQGAPDQPDERLVAWGTRLALPTSTGIAPGLAPVVAEVGFHGPPDPDGWVEIGYRVVAARRRQGLAEEAVEALLAWAARHGAGGVKASTDPDNTASIQLLRKLGFTGAGSYRHDVLGLQLLFHRPAASPAA